MAIPRTKAQMIKEVFILMLLQLNSRIHGEYYLMNNDFRWPFYTVSSFLSIIVMETSTTFVRQFSTFLRQFAKRFISLVNKRRVTIRLWLNFNSDPLLSLRKKGPTIFYRPGHPNLDYPSIGILFWIGVPKPVCFRNVWHFFLIPPGTSKNNFSWKNEIGT